MTSVSADCITVVSTIQVRNGRPERESNQRTSDEKAHALLTQLPRLSPDNWMVNAGVRCFSTFGPAVCVCGDSSFNVTCGGKVKLGQINPTTELCIARL